MTKKILSIFILFLSLSPLFSITDQLKQFETDGWCRLEKVIKDNEDRSIVDVEYSSYMESDVSHFEKARGEYIYSRYLADNGYREEAKEHLKQEKTYLDDMDKTNDIIYMIARIDYTSSKTYIDKDYLSSGLENSNLVKEAVKKYPEEAYFIITNGWRLIFTPQIAGGSNKNAIKEMEPLLGNIDTLSLSNVYSLYGALATAHFNRKNYEESSTYLSLALDIYNGEPALMELKKDLEKKLK